ncbi:galactose mutarotase-like domain-containing protein [Catenaria anguillulae PL171]|uniref:Glucose-6-phosphate 1-epimerase n=1 Tax=Catenaria anguillulae PL171 TaxID=765915 RepID=A0A1Y2HWM0_9FUNG|nr:galactose mutarotase-like domain-containing protein [Catenaria anguillulae PL171]
MPFTADKDTFHAHLAANAKTGFTVHYYGATVSSWTVNGHEQLFLSKKAILNGTKAIRIPLVFPQFGTVATSKLPQHGFARCSFWKLTQLTESGDQLAATFTLTPDQVDPALRALWDYKFELAYDVTLDGAAGTLKTALRVKNFEADRTFDFTWLLHTYLRVPTLSGLEVQGLSGFSYTDKTRQLQTFNQSGAITITEEVDRVFPSVTPITAPLQVVVGGKPIASIERTPGKGSNGFADVVVWNPWADKAKGMADFGDDEYHEMVCVEVGDVANPVKVGPGEVREAGQVIRAVAAIAKL